MKLSEKEQHTLDLLIKELRAKLERLKAGGYTISPDNQDFIELFSEIIIYLYEQSN